MINKKRFFTNSGRKPIDFEKDPFNVTFKDNGKEYSLIYIEIYVAISWTSSTGKDLLSDDYGHIGLGRINTSLVDSDPSNMKHDTTYKFTECTEEMFPFQKYLDSLNKSDSFRKIKTQKRYCFEKQEYYRLFLHRNLTLDQTRTLLGKRIN